MTTESQNRPRTLSRGTDHLGTLGAALRDLGGAGTILHELTQNADDSKSARTIRFTVSGESLTVWNDGQFTDCGKQFDETCPWLELGHLRCDLHAFRLFAARNKATESDTTGAFGVGFTAVYQLTDHPELLTGDWHWILRDDAAENDRIQICEDSTCGREHGGQGTTIVLPWCRDLTPMRRALEAQPVSDSDIDKLERSLLDGAAGALLFLERVETIEIVTRRGNDTFRRHATAIGVDIKGDRASERWLLLESDFSDNAEDIIEGALGLIQSDRRTNVRVAVPLDTVVQGLLYAGLPTETHSGWGGHIQASFFPRTDRKGVLLDSEYRSEWNRSALRAAAACLADNIELIADTIELEPLWKLFVEIEQLRQQVERGESDEVFDEFHLQLAKVVPTAPIIESVGGHRIVANTALLPQSGDVYQDSDALVRLDLGVVSPELHALVHQTKYATYGIKTLVARHVIDALMDREITESFDPSDGPLNQDDVHKILRTLARLTGRVAIGDVEHAEDVAIIPCLNGNIAPIQGTVAAQDEAEASLFSFLVDGLLIADSELLSELAPDLLDLVDPIDVDQAAALLGEVGAEALTVFAGDLLDWLDNHRADITISNGPRIARLPIFPSSDGEFRPLTELSLRSGFRDPLGVASLVDEDAAGGHIDLLRHLGAESLDIATYLKRHALPLIDDGALGEDQLRSLLALIGESRYELEESDVSDAISAAPLILCEDGEWRAAREVYIPSPELRQILPDSPMVDIVGLDHRIIDTMDWLGASRTPTAESLGEAVTRLAEAEMDPDPAVVELILELLEDIREDNDAVPRVLEELTTSAWLPIAGGGRAKPSEVYPTNQRHLYSSQGHELAIPSLAQNGHSETLQWLGMPRTPTVRMVVAHLKYCDETGTEMNPDVYRFLGNAPDDLAVASLASSRCIQVEPGRFENTQVVFWQPTELGRWAFQLPPERREHQRFFDAVGVKEFPGPRGIRAVLDAVAEAAGTNKVDEADVAVIHECWAQLSSQLESGETRSILEELATRKSMVDGRQLMDQPRRLYFRDGRGLSAEFKLLRDNVIRRESRTWRALEAAGVRRAESLIEIEPYEMTAVQDMGLPAMISDRRGPLLRVLEGQSDFDDQPIDLEILEDIKVLKAPTLEVKYRASLFSRVEVLPSRPVDAVFLADQKQLIYHEGAPASAISRELARALDPDGDTARIAVFLGLVLNASSVDEAHRELDRYGIDDLDYVERESQTSQVIEEFDVGDSPEPDWEPIADRSTEDPTAIIESTDSDATSSGTDDEPELDDNDADLTEHELNNADHSAHSAEVAGNSTPTSPARSTGNSRPSTSRARHPSGLTSRPSAGIRDAKPRPQTRLRSYVVSGDDGDRGTIGDEAPAHSEIDAAGVSRVIAYEQGCGRDTHEMDHANPGFDIESLDKSGTLVRRIEVKSTGGAWSTRGVMLSSRQHEQAVQDLDLYWLYVVENAEDDDTFRVYRIQDPASRIDYFGFDDGWKEIVEPDVQRDATGTPTANSTRNLLSAFPGQGDSASD